MASSSMKLLFFLQLLAMVLRRTVCQNAATQLIYDTEGAPLRSDESYFILPANGGGGGGLDYIPTGWRCLNFVAQPRNQTFLGTPLQFTPPSTNASDGDVELIRLSSDVWVEFHDLRAFCGARLDWHLTDQPPPSWPSPSSSPSGRQLVAAGNQDGIRSYKVFQIKRHSDAAGYKLAYCGDKGPACRDVGLVADKDQTWLTPSDEPYLVVFKKRHV